MHYGTKNGALHSSSPLSDTVPPSRDGCVPRSSLSMLPLTFSQVFVAWYSAVDTVSTLPQIILVREYEVDQSPLTCCFTVHVGSPFHLSTMTMELVFKQRSDAILPSSLAGEILMITLTLAKTSGMYPSISGTRQRRLSDIFLQNGMPLMFFLNKLFSWKSRVNLFHVRTLGFFWLTSSH